MKKVTRVLLFTIVAAMLLSFAPFYAFAIVHDVPTADAVITVAGGVSVTVSKDKPEYILEFTAPEDGDYVIWSEAGYADDLCVEMYDADGDFVSDSDDMFNERYHYNFKLAFEAAEGEKYYFAVSSFDHIVKTTANVFVKKAVPATGIEVIGVPNPATTVSDESFYLNYRLLPANAAPEAVNIESSAPSVVNTEYGTLEYLNVGEATITLSLERDATIKTSFDVKVLSPSLPKINLGEIASPTTGKFEFTAPEDGSYVFYSTEQGVTFRISDGPEVEKTVLDMTKGESAVVITENNLLAAISHGGIGVKKATNDKAFELALYMEHTITPLPLKAETVYPGQPIVIVPVLTDPASVHELDIDFEIEPSADVTAEKEDGLLFVEFEKPGTYTVSAQDNGGNKVTKTVVVSDYNKVTLDKPYVHTFEKTLFNGSLIPVQFPVSFTAPEDGTYYIEVSDDMGLSNSITLFGDTPYGGVTSVSGPLSKDETVVLNVFTAGNGEATFKTGTANVTVTAKKFVDVTDISLPETVTVHLGQAKTVDILPVPANGNILYQEIDVNGIDGIYAYVHGNKLVIDATDVEEPCEATVSVKYKDDEIQKTINVNVTAPRKIQVGVPTVVEDGSLCEAFTFIAPKDGVYSFVVDDAMAVVDDSEILDTEDSLLARSASSSVSYYYYMGDSDVISLTPIKDGGSVTVTEAVDATSIYVPGGVIAMGIADRIEYYEIAQRYVRTTPENAVPQNITKVTVADPSVAVFENGQLIALKKGTTKIELESDYGLKTTAMLQVVGVEPIVPSKVYLNKQELTLEEGESETLVATAEPIENAEFYWMSSDESVVTVDQNGKITAKKPGTATVSASYFGIFTECTVTVTEKPPVEIKDTTKIFKDVEAGRWYVNAINYNYSYGFIAGMSADTFGVSNQITRGQFITILARIAGVDTSANANKTTTKFTDVESGRFYTAAIKWASDNKIVAGMTDTTFAPTAPIQRQQLCVMIVNFAKNQKIGLTAAESAVTFADASSIGNYAKAAVATCQRADIINGYNEGGKLVVKPANTATRAEAAQILYKFHKDFVAK